MSDHPQVVLRDHIVDQLRRKPVLHRWSGVSVRVNVETKCSRSLTPSAAAGRLIYHSWTGVTCKQCLRVKEQEDKRR